MPQWGWNRTAAFRCGETRFRVGPYRVGGNFPTEGFVSIQAIVAAMLERELIARGVQSLGHPDCLEIVEKLIQRLTELDRQLALHCVDRER